MQPSGLNLFVVDCLYQSVSGRYISPVFHPADVAEPANATVAVTGGADPRFYCHGTIVVPFPKVKQSETLWPGLLACIMETLVPEDASKTKDEVEAQDNDEVCVCAAIKTLRNTE